MPNVSKELFPDFSLHIVCKLVNLKIIAEKSVYFLMIEPKNTLKNLKTYDVPAYPEKWAMKLDSNENYTGPSSKVLNAIKNITIDEISHYPYYGGLYDALCTKYDVSKSSIVITNGADEAIFALINTYMTQQSSMLTVTPAFSMPKIYAAQIGCEYVEVPYEKRWEFPFESFVKSVKQNTKIIWLTSPNNPTGTVIAPEQIKYILEHFKDRLVVVDETYGAFSDYSCIQLVKTYKNLAVVKSMSKDYALAGLRLGFVVSDSKNILNIKKMLSPYNVNAVAAKAAIAAVSDDQHFQKMKAELNKSKKFLTEEFKKLKVKVYDSHANFILAEFGEKTDYVYNVLLKNRIIVKKYDELGALRITLPAFEAAKNLAGLITTRDVIVFDMDGVLVDVQNSYRLAIAETYKYFTKREISQEDIKAAKNLGGKADAAKAPSQTERAGDVCNERITIDDFAKVELKVGEVIACERVPKSKKLLHETIRVGSEVRSVVSGIAKWYTPEEMVGKKVVLVTNLQPATLCGVLSEGMVLCAEDAEGNLSLLSPEKDLPSGALIR